MQIKMLKRIATMVLWCVSMACSHIHATCQSDVISLTSKFYVHMDQISFFEDVIQIVVEGFVYQTPAVFSDEYGYYIEKVARSGDCSWNQWECSRCRECNLRGIDWRCRACYKPISS